MKLVLLCCVVGVVSNVSGYTDIKKRSFSNKFLFGTATAAYQVEGAWNEDGKTESIWDKFAHDHPELIASDQNGDVAADSYHNVERDVEMLRELGVDFYRFSISWTRILPTGFPNKINEKGLQYYEKLIGELLKHKIQPMVTLYHFDLPQSLQQLGGWVNPLSTTWFEDYARVVFNRFADKVQYWITVNQPNTICLDGYGGVDMAPGINSKGVGEYICVKNILLAHAKAYRLYEREFKAKHKGSVGITVSVNWLDPLDVQSETDKKAAEIARAFNIGLYLDPIWSKTGDYPDVVKETVARNSREQGFTRSRLPSLSADEKQLLKGSADFLGMNHYTTFLVTPTTSKYEGPSFQHDMALDFSQGELWKQAKSSWLKSAPYGLYKAIIHLNLNYDYPAIIITEHGWSTDAVVHDKSRAEVLRGYLSSLLLALEDGGRVLGYTAWSLMDNVEWSQGTSECFGLYQVDYNHPNRTRRARLSALVYKHIIETRVVEDWTPPDLNIKITPKKHIKTEL